MQCANQIIHTIRAGDTLYSLANRYLTSVEQIRRLNPGVETYNLQIGTGLVICPGITGATPVPPIGTVPPAPPVVSPQPPIGTIPPVRPIPPIAPLPPVLPPEISLPPIGSLPTPEVLRELLLLILRWIEQHFGNGNARRIIEFISNELSRVR